MGGGDRQRAQTSKCGVQATGYGLCACVRACVRVRVCVCVRGFVRMVVLGFWTFLAWPCHLPALWQLCSSSVAAVWLLCVDRQPSCVSTCFPAAF